MIYRYGVDRLIRSDLARAGAYSPIRPPDILSEGCGIPAANIIKLDGNENPYGCSPRVRRALANFDFYHIYPDPEQRDLRLALQEYVGVGADRILAGAGSDELIDLILRLTLETGDQVVDCPPTFGMYPFCTEICGGKVLTVPRDEAFGIDISRVRNVVTSRTKVIFVASPNNPSGNTAPEKQVKELLELGILVVVDEAYYEFSGVTVMPLVGRHDNLIVLRTFSKWAGLAGLRIGYGAFPYQLMPSLMKIKQPYNINAAAQVAVIESLRDVDCLMENVRLLVHERGRLFQKLQQFSFLKVYPSQANFILCRVAGGKAKHICDGLQRRGIFIRYFDTPLLRDCIRISVGKPEHTEAVVVGIEEIMEEDEEAKIIRPKL
jgi:histidinol-phosphate aminotransferase